MIVKRINRCNDGIKSSKSAGIRRPVTRGSVMSEDLVMLLMLLGAVVALIIVLGIVR